MTRCREATLASAASQNLHTGAAGSADAVAAWDYTTYSFRMAAIAAPRSPPTVSALARRPPIRD